MPGWGKLILPMAFRRMAQAVHINQRRCQEQWSCSHQLKTSLHSLHSCTHTIDYDKQFHVPVIQLSQKTHSGFSEISALAMQVFNPNAEQNMNMELFLAVTKKDSSNCCRSAHSCNCDSRIVMFYSIQYQQATTTNFRSCGIYSGCIKAFEPKVFNN